MGFPRCSGQLESMYKQNKFIVRRYLSMNKKLIKYSCKKAPNVSAKCLIHTCNFVSDASFELDAPAV